MRIILVVFTLLWLSGCAYKAEKAPAGSWLAQKNALAQLQQWQLSARLGIITSDERGSLSLFWRQNRNDYRMNLTNVVGKRVFDLSRQGRSVQLTDSDGQQHQAADARELVQRLTGWDLPVEQLSYWIKGLPGATDQVTYDEHGRPSTIKAHGWELRYLGYTQIEGLWLPSRLDLSHQDTKLRLAINQWELN
ncbi:outer-membrane lipoprotein LolB [Oceanisphaera marina]|uniref:Outer-membrane lipoprotein LolB n=1 Tax=Oceanisphaera marina TaxID=2017550 RepID=A0ABQ1IBP1_9GAMM|nr:lipoprotein insertase outer membrane protein LolB [Oceanisphaera marina]GGB31910.1 outer-membrane lipoprotein LolB [Oceanisphaera marina]